MRVEENQRGRPAITVIELVVVMAILGLLVALLVSAVQRVRGAAVAARCRDNLRQIGLALHNYHSAKQSFPEGCTPGEAGVPYPFMSWNARILPYIEREDLWRQAVAAYAVERNWKRDPPHPFAHVVRFFGCESDPRTLAEGLAGEKLRVSFTIYLGVLGTNVFQNDGVLFENSRVRQLDISDGASNTLMVGERPPSADQICGWWYAGWGQNKSGSLDMTLGVREQNVYGPFASCPRGPYNFVPGKVDNNCDAFHFWSLHPGGAHFAFADGSVRFLAYSADPVLPALATRAGGEVAAVPD